MVTLPRLQTDLFNIQLVQDNESSPSGDFWEWAYNYPGFSATEYNQMVDEFIANVQLAKNNELLGTPPVGDPEPLIVFPNHPRPPRKPES